MTIEPILVLKQCPSQVCGTSSYTFRGKCAPAAPNTSWAEIRVPNYAIAVAIATAIRSNRAPCNFKTGRYARTSEIAISVTISTSTSSPESIRPVG